MRAEELPVPVTGRPAMGWGSDAVAELLARLDLPYVSLVPGSSYRGLHDSLVNYLGNTKPEIVLCLHEEHAVAIAQGYAKVTGRPMAVALHSNVGLMHATMAVFDAFCDRVPMMVLGATGPVDAALRRPWIDWIHTTADQAALIRNYCKWDDQPASVAAALESVMRAYVATRTYPSAPTYVCLDAALQEAPLAEPVALPAPERHPLPAPPAPSTAVVAQVLDALREARRPLVLVGRVGRGEQEWAARVELVERLGACALTDLKTAAGFPTRHPLHPAVPGTRVTASGLELMRRCDLVLSLDWVDLAGTLAVAFGQGAGPRVISCTDDFVLHNGWSKDHFGLAPAEMSISADPDLLVVALLDALNGRDTPVRDGWPAAPAVSAPRPGAESDGPHHEGELAMRELAESLQAALAGRPVAYTSFPHGWPGEAVDLEGPLDYLGHEGGGGVGAGPGIAVGAALALARSGRLPVAVIGDGDYLMGASALWTAAHHRLPLLVVVANNRSYFNDEVHQERVALQRGRPVENRSVGQHIRNPDPDLAALASSLGLKGHGPVDDPEQLKAALEAAVSEAEAGEAVVVDVRVSPHGYVGAAEGNRRGAA